MPEKTFLEGTTLAERQMRYFNGSQCIYCNGFCDLVDEKEIYNGKSFGAGLMYYCRKCKAWVGTHRGTDQSMGTVAKQELRTLRHEVHKWFDSLRDKKISQGFTRKAATSKAYKWLAEQLGIDRVECHIGFFLEDRCQKTIELCKPFFLTPEQSAVKNEGIDWAKFRTEIVYHKAGEYDFQVTVISDYNLKLTIGGNGLDYFPATQKAKWVKTNTFFVIEDIEKWIDEYFKNKKQKV